MSISKTYLQSMPLMPATEIQNSTRLKIGRTENSMAFTEALTNAEKKVKFSGHAQQRLESRNIKLSDEELGKIDDMVDRLSDKGARVSLLYLDDIALVVSVKKRTVITALDGPNAKNNIFTNIDSAAII